MGKGAFPESHELHFGWPGMHGPKWSNLAMNTCDVLVAVGARFDDRVTGKLAAFAPGATVVHLDVDPAEISKLRERGHPRRRPAQDGARVPRGRDRAPPRRRRAGTRAVARPDPRLARGVPAALRRERRVAQAAARARAPAGADRRHRRDRHDGRRPAPDVGDAVPRSPSARGASSPRAGSGRWATASPPRSGAKAARPEATVVCVDGDGCFQMTAQELVTAVVEELPIVVVLVNNGYLGMVTQWQDMFFDGRRSHVHLTPDVPDYALLAEAYGGVGMVVTNEEELDDALAEALTAAADGRRRLPRRPGRAVLPDDPDRCGRGRHARVPSRPRSRRRRRREAHAVGHRRGQARGAEPDHDDVRAPRLQHRVARGRADRARRASRASRCASTARGTRSSRSRSRSTSSSTCSG